MLKSVVARLSILFILTIAGLASAQMRITYPIWCGFNGSASMGQNLAPAAPRAIQDVQRIAAATNTPVWQIYQGGVPNACATDVQKQIMTPMGPRIQNVQIIVYNPAFMENAVNRYGPWAGVGVIAHECGHHVNMDTSIYGTFKHPWTKELKADAFAGYSLARMGASLQEAQQFQYTVYNLWGSTSHPDSPRRLAAVQQGWMAGGGSGSLMGSAGSKEKSTSNKGQESDDIVDVIRDDISNAKDSASPSPTDTGFYVVEARGRWWFSSVIPGYTELDKGAFWSAIGDQSAGEEGMSSDDWVSFESTSDARAQRRKWIKALKAAGARVREVEL